MLTRISQYVNYQSRNNNYSGVHIGLLNIYFLFLPIHFTSAIQNTQDNNKENHWHRLRYLGNLKSIKYKVITGNRLNGYKNRLKAGF